MIALKQILPEADIGSEHLKPLANCVLAIASHLAPKTSNPIPVHILILLQAFLA